jgi:hypothetical protein
VTHILSVLILLTTILIIPKAQALPIDWHGAFGVDTTLLDNFRRIESTTDNSNNTGLEPGLTSGNHGAAHFESYIFRLNPNIIINDSASLKGEFSSGYGRGGYLGEASQTNLEGSFGNALYHLNGQDGANSIVLNQFYLQLFSDTATYEIGRHTTHWGLGAVENDGGKLWDRHASSRDGITMKVKVGSFYFQPFWSKVAQGASLTRATDIKQWGFSLLYDNPERDLSFGILYSLKENNSFNASVVTDINNPSTTNPTVDNTVAIGSADIKTTDIYAKKTIGDFDVAIEVPLMSGEIGNLYGVGQTSYEAKAYIIESNYNLNESWSIGLDAGMVSGDKGDTGSFAAMFLNPNYQVANFLFRYNLRAISATTTTQSIYDSYVTNAQYIKFKAGYKGETWDWDFAVLTATAQETATTGSAAYNHEANHRISSSNTTQDANMGIEVDINFRYKWNKEISVGGGVGYLMTGDYFTYTNDTTVVNTASNALAIQVNTGVSF